MSGKVAMVTGAGKGIGRAVARRLAADNTHVGVCDLSLEAARQVVDEITADGGSASAYQMDARQRLSVAGALSALVRDTGQLNVLVANAGVMDKAPFLEFTDAFGNAYWRPICMGCLSVVSWLLDRWSNRVTGDASSIWPRTPGCLAGVGAPRTARQKPGS